MAEVDPAARTTVYSAQPPTLPAPGYAGPEPNAYGDLFRDAMTDGYRNEGHGLVARAEGYTKAGTEYLLAPAIEGAVTCFGNVMTYQRDATSSSATYFVDGVSLCVAYEFGIAAMREVTRANGSRWLALRVEGKTKVSNPGMATTIPLDRPAPSARSVRIRSATSRIFSRQTVSAVTLASIAGVLLCVLGWLVLRESAVRAKVLGPPPAETPPDAPLPAAPPTSPVPPPTSAREPVAAALPAAPEARAEAPAPKPMALTLWLGGEAITEATVTLFPEEGAPIRLTGAPYVADLPAGARFDLRVEAGHQGAARWRAAEASGLVAAGHVAFRGLEPAEARRVRVRGFQVVSGGAPVAEVRGTLLQYGGPRVFGPCAPEELAGFLRAFAALDGRFALRFDDADGRPLARFDMALAKPEAGDATPLLAGVRLDLATGAVTLYEEGSDE